MNFRRLLTWMAFAMIWLAIWLGLGVAFASFETSTAFRGVAIVVAFVAMHASGLCIIGLRSLRL